MLEINHAGSIGPGNLVNSLLPPEDQKLITDEQLVRFYQNGERKQQYAEELKASHSPKPQQSPLTKIIRVQQKEAGSNKSNRARTKEKKQG